MKYLKECPRCSAEQSYTTKGSLNSAIKANRLCVACGAKDLGLRQSGEGNPFWGKKHSAETIAKILEDRDYSIYKTDEFRDKISKATTGEKNPMFGKTVYKVWVERHGEEVANLRVAALKEIQSKNSSGSNNPMYGKPSPQGSGNGWSGWFQGFYFRSLLELNFLLESSLRQDSCKSAESIKIPYLDWLGTSRTYSPDFIVGQKIFECKPEKLQKSPAVLLKKAAAETWCADNGFSYHILDPGKPDPAVLMECIKKGSVVFLEKYKDRVNEYLNDRLKKAAQKQWQGSPS